MESQTTKITINYSDRQLQAYNALHNPSVRRLLYGGAKGGGKSWLLCTYVFDMALSVIKKFGLKPTKNPIHLGWIGRKQATDFTATTLQTWRQVIPEQYYELKGGTEKDPKHILICDTIAIDYGGLDKQENINKFNSAEYAFFAIDQAEETTKDNIAVLRGSLRLKVKGCDLDYKELYTANPAHCWLKDDFIGQNIPQGNVFVPALSKDNPYLPESYEQTLIDAFGYRKELLEAYLYGSWDSLDTANQVILNKWIETAMLSQTLLKGKVVSCDVARFGDDLTIIMVLDGTEILEHYELSNSRTTETASKLLEISRNHQNCPIVIDEIGIGSGVVDDIDREMQAGLIEGELYNHGRRVVPFNSSAKAENPIKYYNRRAEAWWTLAELYSRAEIGHKRMYSELQRELIIPTYDFRNGKILIESKADIKVRLGHSPDHADCYVMGIWALLRNMPTGRENEEYQQGSSYICDYEPIGVE